MNEDKEVQVIGNTCNCGHDLDSDHGPDGCARGCAASFCATGEPALKDGVTEQLDEDGIPWL